MDRSDRRYHEFDAIDVLIVSGSRVYRDCLADVLGREDAIKVTGLAEGWGDGLESIEQQSPHVILVEIVEQERIRDIRLLGRAKSTLKILALGRSRARAEAAVCARAGATGYVSRNASLEELVQAVKLVAEAEIRPTREVLKFPSPARIPEGEPSPEGLDGQLTGREIEVLVLIDRGLSNKEIARLLCIELATAKNHVHSILRKLHLHRRTQVAAWLREQETGKMNPLIH